MAYGLLNSEAFCRAAPSGLSNVSTLY